MVVCASAPAGALGSWQERGNLALRNPRKYVVLTLFSLILIGLFVFNLGRELWPWGSRLDVALAQDRDEYAVKGAKLYALNCMQCHGPRGEGVVGMPLNREDLQGDPTDSKFSQRYDSLRSTIANGRPGTTVPTWVKVEDGTPGGSWASYSQMPAWGREAGGPLDEHNVKALVYFIMMGGQEPRNQDPDSTYWGVVGSDIAPAQPMNVEALLPDAKGMDPQQNETAKQTIKDRGCLNCHSIGSRGAKIGPDLSYVGDWGVDADFLREWIRKPSAMPTDKRMPVYWSQHRSVGQKPDFDKNKRVIPAVETKMPDLNLKDQDLDLIVKYLLGQKK